MITSAGPPLALSIFEKLILENRNAQGTALLLVLCWLAKSDGEVDPRELNRIHEIAKATNHSGEMQALFGLVDKGDVDALQLSFEILKDHASSDRAELLIEIALGLALADGYFPSSENHIIRLFADTLNISPLRLDEIFLHLTQRNFPDPADPSSTRFWEDYASRQSSNKSSRSTHDESGSVSQRHRALSVLGLNENASIQDVKAAFRRLSLIHHPDRFSSLGQEAVAAATETFRRIREAYEYLNANA